MVRPSTLGLIEHTVDTNADEIQRATQKLGFGPASFRRVPTDNAQDVYESASRQFVPQGAALLVVGAFPGEHERSFYRWRWVEASH